MGQEVETLTCFEIYFSFERSVELQLYLSFSADSRIISFLLHVAKLDFL